MTALFSIYTGTIWALKPLSKKNKDYDTIWNFLRKYRSFS